MEMGSRTRSILMCQSTPALPASPRGSTAATPYNCFHIAKAVHSQLYYTVMLLFVIYLVTLFTYAFGHGYVHRVVVGGQAYEGWNPFSDPCVFLAYRSYA